MEISVEQKQAYAEIDNFLGLLDEETRNKVPEQLRKIFKEEKAYNYNKKIDVNKPISEQNLKDETLAIIALLNLKYWCNDENEKKRLKEIYSKNEEKYQEILREKYNTDNLFKNRDSRKNLDTNKEETALVVKNKGSIFRRLMNFIKRKFNNK